MALQQTEVCPDSDLNVSFTCLELFLCACEKGVCVCVCAKLFFGTRTVSQETWCINLE